MMEQVIRDFAKQFAYKPQLQNASRLRPAKKFVLCGMGGSGLVGGLVLALKPEIDLIIHRDYGLPAQNDLAERLLIFNSYSGNTEEILDGFAQAQKQNLHCLGISTGGQLLQIFEEQNLPFIQLPNTGIQPRMALGFNLLAVLGAIGEEELLREAQKLSGILDPEEFQPSGQTLARKLRNAVPVIYASARNLALAYNWKIKLNETGKIPAFYNVLPELNHNEMTGFDVVAATKSLSQNLHFLFLTDVADSPAMQKRFAVLQTLYEARGLSVTVVPVTGQSRLVQIFSSLLTADWLALTLGTHYGLETEQVPMVEEFKKLIL